MTEFGWYFLGRPFLLLRPDGFLIEVDLNPKVDVTFLEADGVSIATSSWFWK
jgi:hypothetical protein